MGDLYLTESGTKLNRLVQPFHFRRVYCLQFLIPDGLESRRENRGWWKNGKMPPMV